LVASAFVVAPASSASAPAIRNTNSNKAIDAQTRQHFLARAAGTLEDISIPHHVLLFGRRSSRWMINSKALIEYYPQGGMPLAFASSSVVSSTLKPSR